MVKTHRVTSLKKPLIKYGWINAIFFFICFLFFGLIFHLIISIFFGGTVNKVLVRLDFESYWHLKEWVLIVVSNLFSILFWVWIFHKIINRQSFTSIGLEFSGYKDDFISGLLLGFGLTGLGFGILYTFNFLSVESIQFSLKTQLFYVFVYTLISLSEEIAVRGYILQNLSKSFNKYIALVLSSLAFMVIRGANSDWTNTNVVSLFNLFLAGILLGVYCIYKNNLWFPIGANFTWSYFKEPVCGFRGYNFPLNDFGPETIFSHNLRGSDFDGSIILTALIIAGIVYVHRRYSNID